MELTDYQKENQRVVCAAVIYEGVIVTGIRHLDPLMRQTLQAMYPDSPEIRKKFGLNQGFVDQFGNYLTREQALKIAKNKGQIYRRCGGDRKRLYSENLY